LVWVKRAGLLTICKTGAKLAVRLNVQSAHRNERSTQQPSRLLLLRSALRWEGRSGDGLSRVDSI